MIEGPDDKRFFERVVKPLFEAKFDHVQLWEYSTKKKSEINGFIRSIIEEKGDYIFVRDLNQSPCITQRVEKITKTYPKLSIEKLLIVVQEIESWYLAGITRSNARMLRVKIPNSTNKITKEQFNNLIPQNYTDSRINFMIELLKGYSLRDAVQRNKSFSFFIDKFVGSNFTN